MDLEIEVALQSSERSEYESLKCKLLKQSFLYQ